MGTRRQRRGCRVCKIYKTRHRIDMHGCRAINLAEFSRVRLNFYGNLRRCNFFASIGCKSLDIIHLGMLKKLRRLKPCSLFTYSTDNLHEQLFENEYKNSTKRELNRQYKTGAHRQNGRQLNNHPRNHDIQHSQHRGSTRSK